MHTKTPIQQPQPTRRTEALRNLRWKILHNACSFAASQGYDNEYVRVLFDWVIPKSIADLRKLRSQNL